MPRAHRLGVQGGVFHLTHRCHNRVHFLKFARDRDAYRAKMRTALSLFDLSLLDYCLTCNHVHLLVDAKDRLEVSGFMRRVAGEFAGTYNRRKDRINAIWGDNYHATLVDSGQYLWRCLMYIELNMVRCGVVSHPKDWEWLGYHEIMGQRCRYRVLDLERLCWRLGIDNPENLKKNFAAKMEETIARHHHYREGCWTESLAVGSRSFVEQVQPLILSRLEKQLVEEAPDFWTLREIEVPYG
ncbi:MAG TPA: transposase [Methylomirabilota bacterium]|nr:transposase [Methylomirabilota bacterium]